MLFDWEMKCTSGFARTEKGTGHLFRYELIYGMGSKIGARSLRTGRPLMPDIQVQLSGGRWGIIDITTAEEALGKAKYIDPRVSHLVTLLHR